MIRVSGAKANVRGEHSRGGANPRSRFPLPLPVDSLECTKKSTARRVDLEWSGFRRTLPKNQQLQEFLSWEILVGDCG